jgi:hypothetical protein
LSLRIAAGTLTTCGVITYPPNADEQCGAPELRAGGELEIIVAGRNPVTLVVRPFAAPTDSAFISPKTQLHSHFKGTSNVQVSIDHQLYCSRYRLGLPNPV